MAIPGVTPRGGGPLYNNLNGQEPWDARIPADDVEVVIDAEPANPAASPRTDPSTGAIEIPQDDGSIVIDFSPDVQQGESEDHSENLALRINDAELMKIGGALLTAIQEDDRSRQEWLEMRAKGLDLLGLKVENARTGAGNSAAPIEGMSTVRHPLLQEAVLRFQANSYSEMCPARGPAKVVNYSDQTLVNDQLANALERDMNHYLTTTASEYYPDTDRMLWWLGYGGTMFKKVYPCPLRRRPVSEMVDAKDLIVSDAVTDLANAPRVTHEITMRKSVMKRMQILGVYRNTPLSGTPFDPDPVDRKIGEIQGVDVGDLTAEDADYQLYECYCELDIPSFNHVDDEGLPTGLPLPYRVTLEKTTGRILEIRRNWKEDDEDYLPKIPFVQYTFVRGMGFYGIGLLHILGNTTRAVTSAWRLMLDAGMFANFPGFLFAKSANRQVTNEFRVPPGGGAPIDLAGMQDIRQAVMPLPYKEPGPALMQLTKDIADTGQRVGGTAEAPVGEGVQNAPVGTTLALIEQATRIEGAVHKRLHQAQSEELQKLVALFREDPESLWRSNRRCQLKKDTRRTLMALEDCDIVPFADPSVPSRMHRLAKVAAVKQLQAQSPQLYNPRAVDEMCLMEIGIADPESLFAPDQAPPQPDPIMVEQLKLKAREVDIQEMKAKADVASKEKDRVLKENLATMQVAERIATHPGSLGMVEKAVGVMPKLMQNADQAAGRDGSGTGVPAPSPARRPLAPPPTRPPAFGPIGMPGNPGMSVVPPPPRRPASAGGSMTRRPIRPIDLSRFN